jgi:AraC-like DNA-binding protein
MNNKGFEFAPQGSLLEQVIDLEPKMGLAYERSCGFFKDFHVHDGLMLVFPRGSCVMEVRTKVPSHSFTIDQSSVLVVPAKLEHDDEGMSSIYDTIALFPNSQILATAASVVNISQQDLLSFTQNFKLVLRTQWLEQLLQNYFALRVVGKSTDNEVLNFFEQQILIEMLSTVYKSNDRRPEIKLPSQNEENVGARALKFIEANLFEDIELDVIARKTYASVSSLLRQFKKQTGQTPYNYIKRRRLEEAMKLLKVTTHNVSEVALLIGYNNFGAFSEAFKEKYKISPSDVTKNR